MRKSLAFILLAFFSLGSADVSSPFPGLKEFEVMYSKHFGPIRVYYAPQYSTFFDTKISVSGQDYYRIMQIRLDNQKNETVEVGFTQGTGMHPEFVISRGEYNGHNAIKSLTGLELTIPGNGSLYVAGHAETFYNDHRKYNYVNGQINEIKQPYKYVGLKSITKKDIDIYSDKNLTTVVAHLPKDSKLELVLNEGDYYLVKTEFGLLGWYKHNPAYRESEDIDGLYYNGDK